MTWAAAHGNAEKAKQSAKQAGENGPFHAVILTVWRGAWDALLCSAAMSLRRFEPVLLGAAVVLFLPSFLPGHAHAFAMVALRWLGVLLVCAVAVGRRTLTPWIFAAHACRRRNRL